MPDFSKGRIGESVYSLEHGEGEIAGRDGKNVLIKFVRHSAWYDYEGFPYNREAYKVPILYWSKPEISDPQAPQRMRKVKGFVPIWEVDKIRNDSGFETGAFYAENPNLEGPIAIIPVEFEVPENA